MKKANTIISLFLMSSLFAASAVSGVTLNSDSKLALNCSQDVYGLQFDMHFDPSLISIDELTGSNSLVPGVDLFSKVKEEGFVRVLMFSMDLDKVANANELSDIIDFTVTPMSGVNNATITFDNIILAGENGQELDYPSTYTYDLNSDDLLPNSTELSNIYPNPFNPSTTIEYALNAASDVSLHIYDMQGRVVKTLVSNNLDAGSHSIVWKGINDNGVQVSSGMYLVRMEANGQAYQQAITLLK